MLGICNGFQILTEAGLLPGVLMRNAKLKFVCGDVHLKVETSQSLFTNRYQAGQVIKVPVAHAEGNYFADDDTLKRLEDRGQVAFRYCAPDGTVDGTRQSQRLDPQHRRHLQRDQDVLGLMPHPENAIEPLFGGTDGKALFEGLVEAASRDHRCREEPAGQAAQRARDHAADRGRARPRARRIRARCSRSWAASPPWSSSASSR